MNSLFTCLAGPMSFVLLLFAEHAMAKEPVCGRVLCGGRGVPGVVVTDDSGLVRDGLMAFRLESFPESTGTPVEMTLKWKSYSGEKTLKFKYIPRK